LERTDVVPGTGNLRMGWLGVDHRPIARLRTVGCRAGEAGIPNLSGRLATAAVDRHQFCRPLGYLV
jgi:hypothetical protein